MIRVKGVGLVGVACGGLVLSACAGSVPTHETPGWGHLVDEVQSELATIVPEPANPADTVDPSDPYANLTRTSPNAVVTNWEDVARRQCILYPYDDDGNLTETVQVVPCIEPHYGEVYVTGEFTGEVYSGEFDGIVTAACEEAFGDYFGIDYWSSELFYDYSYTSQYGWGMGLRGWRCYAIEADNENSGSLEGTHR